MKNFLLPITDVVKLRSLLALTIVFFCINFGHSQVIPINQTFSSDTILTPFTGSIPVYSLRMSGGINLLSDSSLVRVVLIDPYGNHYLVYESYSLITPVNSFDTLDASDETAFLNGVICDSLRIDIINAFLDLDSLKPDTNYIPNATELQAQAKWDHDSVKIDIMNQRITEEHMYWRAGRTDFVNLFFHMKETMYGMKYSLHGFDYYIGGIFEFFLHRLELSSDNITEGFDWRSKHNADVSNTPYYDNDPEGTGWITGFANTNYPSACFTVYPFPLGGQGVCWACWNFAPIAAAEARVNIWFNSHNPENGGHYDIDLAEQQVLCEQFYNMGCEGMYH